MAPCGLGRGAGRCCCRCTRRGRLSRGTSGWLCRRKCCVRTCRRADRQRAGTSRASVRRSAQRLGRRRGDASTDDPRARPREHRGSTASGGHRPACAGGSKCTSDPRSTLTASSSTQHALSQRTTPSALSRSPPRQPHCASTGPTAEPASTRRSSLRSSTRTVPAESRPCNQLFLSLTRAADDDWAGAVDALALGLEQGPADLDSDVLSNLGNAALHLGDDESHRRYFRAMLAEERQAGAGFLVMYGLHRLAFSQLLGGDWHAVRAGAEEALSLSHAVGEPGLAAAPAAWLTLLAALQGTSDYEARLTEVQRICRHLQPLGSSRSPSATSPTGPRRPRRPQTTTMSARSCTYARCSRRRCSA